MTKKTILSLLGVKNERQLNYSDRILLNDLLAIIELSQKKQSGGGFSIRPDLGELNGLSYRTGYLDKHPPIFVGELLRDVAMTVNGVNPGEVSIVRPFAE